MHTSHSEQSVVETEAYGTYGGHYKHNIMKKIYRTAATQGCR